MLEQVGLEALSLAFRHKLVKQIDIDYSGWLLVKLLLGYVI